MKAHLKKAIDNFWSLSDDFSYDVLLDRKEYPFRDANPGFEDDVINKSFQRDNQSPHYEYIKRLNKRIIIEPDFSFAITDFNKIVRASVPYINLRPSFPRYLRSFFIPKKHFAVAILFDGTLGENYFHFFSDVINKVWLLPHIENYKSIPLIIGESVYNRKYFQYILQHTDLKDLNWVVQKKGEYITTDALYMLHPKQYSKEYVGKLKQWLQVPDPALKTQRVFITRSPKSGRFIENMDQILPILSKYGFEVLDLDNKPLSDQIKLFSSASHLISIHGAGETNIIFSDSSMKFLEILPGNRLSCQYYWLASVLELSYYNVIKGGDLPGIRVYPEGGFHLSPEKLEQAIQKMIS